MARALPFPSETRARWPHPQRGPWQLVGHWLEIDGFMECVGIELWKGLERKPDFSVEAIDDGPAGIGGTDLRLPTAQLLRELRARGRWLESEWRKSHAITAAAAREAGDDEAAAHHEATSEVFPSFDEKPTKRVTSNDREHFAEVARVYLQALVDRVPPTKTVATELHIAPSTAEKHVRIARERFGFLPATSQGRASRPNRKGQ